MQIDDKITDEKLQYDIKREEVEMSALLSSKIDEYEYLKDKEILLSYQGRILEQFILLQEKISKTKQKQLKIKEENK